MNHILKKFLIFVFLLLFVSVSIPVYGTDFGGATYVVDERTATHNLPFNIKHFTELGRSGITTLSKQQVNILEVPATADIKIVPWSKLGSSKWTMTTVRSMAEDFERDNPGYKVLAGINGDFFDISGTQNLPYATVGPHVAMGHYYKITDTPSTTRNPIGFKNDGSLKPIVGNVPYEVSSKMKLTIYGINDSVLFETDIDRVNQEPLTNEIALYYANWGSDKKIIPISSPIGFVVESATHALAFSENDFYGIGTITRQIAKTLYEGEFSIVSNNTEVSQLLAAGVTIRVQYEFAGAYEGIEYATGAGKPIIYDGVFMPDTTDFGIARHPRTMIGSKADGSIVMAVVDGRQTDMTGVSQQEMGAILHHYGCIDAYNLDGGGSSTMIILDDGEFVVTNSPSDGRERSDSNCLLVAVRVPIITFEPIQILENQLTIHATVDDYNGYTFADLYVKCND